MASLPQKLAANFTYAPQSLYGVKPAGQEREGGVGSEKKMDKYKKLKSVLKGISATRR
jgi:hypothetical protein